MIQYFKIATGKFIEYDDATNRATIIVKADLLQQKQELIDRIGVPDPNVPTTNAAWVTWAKEHYPYVDHSAEQRELDRVNAVIEAIKAL